MKTHGIHLLGTTLLILSLGMMSCSENGSQTTEEPVASKAGLEKASFGTLSNGQEVDIYTLTSSTGIVMKVTPFGGIITSLKTPDKNGE
ncbi:hypothetical protein QLX67_13200, partial [Balneolaceae bacterium ANBcel3]|nr:hypothetical protein [Balneolaceae bacterium ANBcel3]